MSRSKVRSVSVPKCLGSEVSGSHVDICELDGDVGGDKDEDKRSKNFDKRPNRHQKNSAPQEDSGKVVDKGL